MSELNKGFKWGRGQLSIQCTVINNPVDFFPLMTVDIHKYTQAHTHTHTVCKTTTETTGDNRFNHFFLNRTFTPYNIPQFLPV